MADSQAGDDELYVCLACGKTSKTRYGLNKTATPGWDESCMLNAKLFPISDLTRNPSGRVVHIRTLDEKGE